MDKRIMDKLIGRVARIVVRRIQAGAYSTADELDADLLLVMQRAGFSWRTRSQQLALLSLVTHDCIDEAEEYAEGLAQIARESVAIAVLKLVRRTGVDPEDPATAVRKDLAP